MYCRNCDSSAPRAVDSRGIGVPDQLCSRCGHLLGADDIVQRVLQKQSQLALFGLAGPHGALLKRGR